MKSLVAVLIAFVFSINFAFALPSEGLKIAKWLPPETELIIYSKSPRLTTTDDLAIFNHRIDFMNNGTFGLMPGVIHELFRNYFFEGLVSHHVVAYSEKSKEKSGVHPLCHLIVFKNNFTKQFKNALLEAKPKKLLAQNPPIFKVNGKRSHAYISLVAENTLFVSENYKFLAEVRESYLDGSSKLELPLLHSGLSKISNNVDFFAVRRYKNGIKRIIENTTDDSKLSEIAVELQSDNQVKLFYFSESGKCASEVARYLSVEGVKSSLNQAGNGIWEMEFKVSEFGWSGPVSRDSNRLKKVGIRKYGTYWRNIYMLLFH